ncbi:MAG: response regulator [Alphaproteobacteria bacterium]|nr:response regulator [Alphaproteobacteria bacterium]
MNKTILIVDDDDMLRRSLTSGLRSDGFNVLSANSAENAQDILTRISVDAIILDRMKTAKDGLTLLSNLRGAGNITPE